MRVTSFAALVPALLCIWVAPVAAADDISLVVQVPPGKLDNGDEYHRAASSVGFSPDNKTVVVTASGYVGVFDMATGAPVLELDDPAGAKVGGWLSADGSVLTTLEAGKYSRRNPVTGAVTERLKQLPIGEASPDGSMTAMPLRAGMPVPSTPTNAKPPAPAAPKPAAARPPSRKDDPEGYEKWRKERLEESKQRALERKKKLQKPATKPSGPSGPMVPFTRSKTPGLLIQDAGSGEQLLALACKSTREEGERPAEIVAWKFSPDSGRIAALLNDGTLNIWDLPDGGDPRVIDAGTGECEGASPGERGSLSWRNAGATVLLTCGGNLTTVDVDSGDATRVRLPNSAVLLPGEPAPERAPGAFPDPDMDGSGPKSDDAGEVEARVYMSLDCARTLQFRRRYPADSAGGRIDHSSRIAVFDTSGPDAALLGRISGPVGEPIVLASFSPDSSLAAFAAARGAVYIMTKAQLDEAARNRTVLNGGTMGDLDVPNPLYRSWEGIATGTRVEFEWSRTTNGNTQNWTDVVLLEGRDETLGLTTRSFDKASGPHKGNPGDIQPNLARYDIPARVPRSEAAKGAQAALGGGSFKRMGGKRPVKVGDRTFQCDLYERNPSQGSGVTQKTKFWLCADAPGFVVKYEDDFEGPNGKAHETKVMSAIVPN